MGVSFGERLRRRRIEKGFSQQQLAALIHVERSSIASWETGRRMPDANMISRLSQCLNVDVGELLHVSEKDEERMNVLAVDDQQLILDGEVNMLSAILPGADIYGFTNPAEAFDFARRNKCQIVFLDIELGRISGLDVCREFLKIEPHMNVVYLTAYPKYSLDAWDTGACGYLLKPLSAEAVRRQLSNLRWPIGGQL